MKSIKYFQFGECWESQGNLPAQQFTGQRLDSTGLYYYGARYYDPTIGRFISADIYIQSINNPLRYTDPTGWWTLGFGLNLNFGAGAGGSGSIMIVFDGHGGIGFVYSGGGGGFGGIGASLTVQGQWTSAERVQDLVGTCVQTGASYDWGVNVGGEWIAADNYQGVNVGVGLGASLVPVEMHSNIETAGVATIRDTRPQAQFPVTYDPVIVIEPQPITISYGCSLNDLEGLMNSGIAVGSTEYQEKIDTSYNAAKAACGEGQMVAWSSEKGYYVIDTG